jgi:hypothetical protein
MAPSAQKQLLEEAAYRGEESLKSLAQSIGVDLKSGFAGNSFFWNVVMADHIQDRSTKR